MPDSSRASVAGPPGPDSAREVGLDAPAVQGSAESPTPRKCCATVGGEPHTSECEALWRATRDFPPAESAARPLAEAFTDADREFLREHRAVSVIEVHQDGSGSIRHWFINVDQAEQIADLLGEPEQSTFAPPGSVQSLADITEGLPTL